MEGGDTVRLVVVEDMNTEDPIVGVGVVDEDLDDDKDDALVDDCAADTDAAAASLVRHHGDNTDGGHLDVAVTMTRLSNCCVDVPSY